MGLIPLVCMPQDTREKNSRGEEKEAKRAKMTVAEEPHTSQERQNFANTIKHHNERELVDQDIWFLVSLDWWKQFQEASQSLHAPLPGPIDNTGLFSALTPQMEGAGLPLKSNLLDKVDYELIHEDGWELLCKKFGCLEGHAIRRSVVEQGIFQKILKVEVELIRLRVARQADLSKEAELEESQSAGFKAVLARALQRFPSVDTKEHRVFIAHAPDKYEPLDVVKLSEGYKPIGNDLYTGLLLVLDEKDKEGNWLVSDDITDRSAHQSAGGQSPPRPSKAAKAPLSSSPQVEDVTPKTAIPLPPVPQQPRSLFGASSSANVAGSIGLRSSSMAASGAPSDGLCGLQNLGNTCFMNSALQCLSNCPPLTAYFLEDKHMEDLNTGNPLGMGGQLAQAYANLIKQLWLSSYRSVIPREFKQTVGHFAPTFSGYQQQDSQELMAFLLDGLHEDLNRIRNKPYVELKEAQGRPDAVVSEEAWADYQKRNDSIIVDLFHGQLKSTLVCPQKGCEKISIKFDPFCYLSLPMPVKKERWLALTFRSVDGLWTKLKVAVPKLSPTVEDVFTAVAKTLKNVSPSEMIMAELTASRVHRIFRKDLGYINERDDLVVYEVPKEAEGGSVLCFIYQRYKKTGIPASWSSGDTWALAKVPVVIRLPRNQATHQRIFKETKAVMESLYGPLPESEAVPMEEEESEEGQASKEEEDVKGTGNGGEAVQNGVKEEEEEEKMEKEKERELASEEEDSTPSSAKNAPPFDLTRVNSYASQIKEPLDERSETVVEPGSGDEGIYVSVDWSESLWKSRVNEAVLRTTEDASLREWGKRKPIQLGDCLRLFQEEEELGQDDLWYCPACKEHRQAFKKMEIWWAPRILIVHLKRFSYSRIARDKIEARVDFPLRGLDMSPYIRSADPSQPVLYDLLAVSNHMGGLGGGHYTAYAMNHKTGRWYSFDDSQCHPLPVDEEVVSKMAYVLFYARRDLPAASTDPNIEMEEADD